MPQIQVRLVILVRQGQRVIRVIKEILAKSGHRVIRVAQGQPVALV